MSILDDLRAVSHAGTCPKCHYVLPPIAQAAPTYFDHGYITCCRCGERVDVWDAVLTRMKIQPPVPTISLVCLGATTTHFEREITADKYHMIDLSEVGVPKDATVLQVGYTTQGVQGDPGVMPIELHGNVPQRRIIGNVLHLLGRALTSGDSLGTVSRVLIWVLWVQVLDSLVGKFATVGGATCPNSKKYLSSYSPRGESSYLFVDHARNSVFVQTQIHRPHCAKLRDAEIRCRCRKSRRCFVQDNFGDAHDGFVALC